MRIVLFAVALALFGAPAAAKTILTQAQCRLPQGQIAEMITRTEVYSSGGLVYPGGRGDLPDFIGSGQYSTHHSGVVRSSAGQYAFTGEGAFINFGHRGPVFQVVWRNRRQYVLRDAYNSGWGDIPCTVQATR